jgi:hypothetical protein
LDDALGSTGFLDMGKKSQARARAGKREPEQAAKCSLQVLGHQGATQQEQIQNMESQHRSADLGREQW